MDIVFYRWEIIEQYKIFWRHLQTNYDNSRQLRLFENGDLPKQSLIPKIEDQFGIKLLEFQKGVCFKILCQEDVFVCAPTGCGKTFCFAFLSALLSKKTGSSATVVVISPLTSLMLDQVECFKKLNIDAAFVGELRQDPSVKHKVMAGLVDALFIRPEAAIEST